MSKRLVILSSLFVFLSLTSFEASASTQIILNGEKTAVYFNDGDTFKVLSGPLKGKRSRLYGYNTLEAYGPVHRWGSFSKKELQRIVDMPDKDINMMIVFLHQNKGVFPKRRRDHFARLTDEEITLMQLAYRKTFELGPVE